MTPSSHIRRLFLLPLAFLWVMLFIAQSAHAGQYRLAKIQARAPVHVARAHARTVNGFPLRQAVANTTLALAYGAGTAYRLSSLIPTPGGVIANILIRPFRSSMPARASEGTKRR